LVLPEGVAKVGKICISPNKYEIIIEESNVYKYWRKIKPFLVFFRRKMLSGKQRFILIL